MRFQLKTTAKAGLTLAMLLQAGLVLAQPAPPAGTAAAPGRRGGFGMMRSDPRVQNRTYHFADTNEDLPYAVFVSSKVTKDKKAPLIIALRGYGGNPTVFLRGAALQQAEEGGYILVGAMGYNSGGSYGMPQTGRGMGRRGGPPTAQPGAPAGTGAPPAARGPSPRGGRGIQAPVAGGRAETDPAKVSELSEKDVMNVLAMVRKEFNVDDRRIYLIGHSQGGAGAYHIADKYPSIWAAAALLAPGAPGFQVDPQAKIKDVPLLIIVGANDTLIASVRRLDSQLKSMNVAHQYKEMPGLDHGGIIMGGIPDVFAFFAQHIKPEAADKKSGTTSAPPATATSTGTETAARTIEDGGNIP